MKEASTNIIPLKALIVDDEEPILEMLESVLSSTGIETIILAHDGKEGLERFRVDNPDIIITDYHMPVMDGVDFFKAVKSENSAIPVIFFTGHTKNITTRLEKDNLKPDYILNKVFLRLEMFTDIFAECFPQFSFKL